MNKKDFVILITGYFGSGKTTKRQIFLQSLKAV